MSKRCLVTVTDARGIQHTAIVEADSLFEAGVLALSALKQDDWTGPVGPSTRLDVHVMEPTVKHSITVQQIQRWLEGACTSPNELVRKKRLKELLG